MTEYEYKGIPVEADPSLRDDEIVIKGVDKDGRLITMRFRPNVETGKMERVGD
jgi:hypothetical protein